LEGGKAVGVCPGEAGPPTVDRCRRAHTGGRVARWSKGRTGDRMRRFECVGRLPPPGPRGRAAPGRRADSDRKKRTEASGHRLWKEASDKVVGRA
jgi:hypothetical protein